MVNEIEKIRYLIENEDYQGVIDLIDIIERNGNISTNLLVIKGRYLQIVDNKITNGLDEAEKYFLKAIETDENYIPALIELGWFYYSVKVDLQKATNFFQKALDISIENIKVGLDGLLKVVEEKESKDTSLTFSKKFSDNILFQIKEIEKEYYNK